MCFVNARQHSTFLKHVKRLAFSDNRKMRKVANAVPVNKVGASEAESAVLCVNFFVLGRAQVMFDLSGWGESSFQGLQKEAPLAPQVAKV